MGLVTIIYCLRFETSLFVASYDSQGYGGGIRPRLHTGGFPNQLRVLLLYPGANRIQNTTSNSSPITASIRCRGNELTEPLSSNGLFASILRCVNVC
jgi:hypothetical protein